MNKDAVVYISIPSYDTPMYRQYKYLEKDSDGMIEVEKSGRIEKTLFVNLPRDDLSIIEMLKPLKIFDVLKVNSPTQSGMTSIGYHVLATI